MGQVVEFTKKRKRPEGHGQNLNDRYYCLRCDRDEFALYASGTINCVHCGSWMKNIHVSSSAEG